MGHFPTCHPNRPRAILPITDRTREYARGVQGELKTRGLRVECDDRNEKIGAKIRDAQIRKIPFMLVAGDREAQARTVSVRSRREGDLGPTDLAAIADRMIRMQAERVLGP